MGRHCRWAHHRGQFADEAGALGGTVSATTGRIAMTMRIAVIVSTYNWPEALSACLRSIAAQTRPPDEVIIADDGSGSATAAVVPLFAHLPLVHVWHPDDGFRLADIRNKAIAAARSDYIISLDGDLMLSPTCVADHESLVQRGSFMQGSRIPLDRRRTEQLLAHGGGLPRWWASGVSRRWKFWRSRPLARLLARPTRDAMSVRGCHQGFWRDDLVAVNGFNGAMEGWGREDNELAVRLLNRGLVRRNIRQAALACHLWHPERPRDQVSTNEAVLHATIAAGLSRCVTGLDRYLPDPQAFLCADFRRNFP
jgi:glycosyltransferase involved in cell wall biosynthesis